MQTKKGRDIKQDPKHSCVGYTNMKIQRLTKRLNYYHKVMEGFEEEEAELKQMVQRLIADLEEKQV